MGLLGENYLFQKGFSEITIDYILSSSFNTIYIIPSKIKLLSFTFKLI